MLRCPRCCSREFRRPLTAKALQKANQEPGELAAQASPALSRRWACPRGPSCVLSPLSSHTAAWPVHAAVISDTHSRHLTPVHGHAHAGSQMCTSLLLTSRFQQDSSDPWTSSPEQRIVWSSQGYGSPKIMGNSPKIRGHVLGCQLRCRVMLL